MNDISHNLTKVFEIEFTVCSYTLRFGFVIKIYQEIHGENVREQDQILRRGGR